MASFSVGVLVLTLLAGPPPAAPTTGARGVLAVGKNVPGPFHPFNVTGPSRGLYHCLVSEYGADPVVLLFSRGLEDNAAFRDLLTRLETAIDRNPTARLRCFVVFLTPDLADPLLDDDRRDKAAGVIDKLSADLKLNKVILTLGGKDQLGKFDLDPDAALTAVLYRKLEILASHAVPADKIDESLVKAIAGEVASRLGAKR